MAIKLRKRIPYTCRGKVGADKVCAAYLTDADGDYCKGCEAVRNKFFNGPRIVSKTDEVTHKPRRFWP